MRRLFSTATIAVALTIPAVATLGFAGVAAAKTGPSPTAGSSVVCTKIKFTASTLTADVSTCYTAGGVAVPKAFKELTTGAGNAEALLSGGTLTWSPGPAGGASITTSSLTSATPTGTCSSKDTNSAYTGTVTGATGTGNPAVSGDVVYVDVCVSSKAKVTLAKGSYAEF